MLRLPSTDGIELAVHDIGPDPRGHQVLLAHATGFHGLVWLPLAQRLSGHAAWAPDLRGHGESPAPVGHKFDWQGFADDVLATVDGLQLHRPFGVGHSKGGAALLLAEARSPGTFSGLWVYEPVVFPAEYFSADGSGGPNPLAAGARQRRATFPSFDAAIENFASKPPLEVFAPDALDVYVRHGFETQPDSTVTLKCRPENEARVYEMAGEHNGWDRLGEVTCPVTVVRGSATEPGPGAFADTLAERLPHGVAEGHDDLGHFGPMQAPARLATSVLAAMERVRPET